MNRRSPRKRRGRPKVDDLVRIDGYPARVRGIIREIDGDIVRVDLLPTGSKDDARRLTNLPYGIEEVYVVSS